MGLRIALVGRVDLEVDGKVVEHRGLGPLGRLAFAYLVTERHRPVSRDELAEVLWGQDLPRSWETSVRVVVSKVRALLRGAGLPGDEILTAAYGCYRLQLPGTEEVDVEQAAAAVETAEAALAAGHPLEARRSAAAAAEVASREFLPGGAGAWVERRQAQLRELRLRALEVLSGASAASGAWAEAVAAAEEAVAVEPFRESAYLRLMVAHAGAGNRGEALRVYERCRAVLVDELGVDPSGVVQAAYARLLEDEPVAAASGVRTPPLPLPLTSFVGREADIAEVERLLSEARLVTLTGTGGVGKTRLALQVAADVAAGGAGAAALVELGPLAEAGLVPAQVGTALGVAEEPGRPATDTLVDHLRERRLLLVLDNCEHLLPACAALAESLLRSCPEVRILATSREPLRAAGETTWRVPSLSTPGADESPLLEDLAGYESARLFLDRARSIRPDLVLAADDAAAVAQLCRRLDGIPLALELAAARVGVLSVRELAERLDDRFRVLAGTATTAPARHRTLRAAVDWTYDSLSDAEAAVFNRLSVFAGSFTMAAAEEVGADVDVDRAEVLLVLSALVEKSLVMAEQDGGRSRYRLLETMRRYGAERLAEAGEEASVRDRHLSWAMALAEQSEVGLLGPDQGHWLEVLDNLLDDARAALGWANGRGDPVAALRLAASLERFWEMRGYVAEGRRWLETALARSAGAPSPVRTKALNSAAILAQRHGDYERARAFHRTSLGLAREAGDERAVAASFHGLGNVAALQGDLSGARSLYEQALDIGRRLGDDQVIGATLTNLGTVAQNQDDFDTARSLYEQSLAVHRRLGDRHGIAMVSGNLAYLAFQQGDHDRARSLYEGSLSLQRELGDRVGIANSLCNLGYLALAEGDHDGARALLDESLAIADAVGDKYWMALSLLRLAKVARAEDDHEQASALDRRALMLARALGAKRAMAEWLEGLARTAVARGALSRAAMFLGAAEAVRDEVGAPVPPAERPGHECDLAAARAGLGDAFAAAWERGRGMSLDEAVRAAAEETGAAGVAAV